MATGPSEKRQRERQVFEWFLELQPQFAGEPLRSWRQPDDENEFPDIEAVTTSGRRIGVELGEWLNEDDKRRESERAD